MHLAIVLYCFVRIDDRDVFVWSRQSRHPVNWNPFRTILLQQRETWTIIDIRQWSNAWEHDTVLNCSGWRYSKSTLPGYLVIFWSLAMVILDLMGFRLHFGVSGFFTWKPVAVLFQAIHDVSQLATMLCAEKVESAIGDYETMICKYM